MPRNHGKIKIQWIEEKAAREATFRKRRATLLEKAKELSILCQIPVAMVVYGPGDAQPACWPEDPEEAKGIMRKYVELPEASKDTHRLDNVSFLRRCIKKMGRRFSSYKATSRQLEVNLILNDISQGRRRNLDDLAPELAAAVTSELDSLRSSVYQRVHALTSAAAAVIPPPPAPEQAAAAEQLMVAPLAMAPPPVVPNEPLFVLPPLPLDPEMLMVPPQEPLMAPRQETPMVPPFAMVPPPLLADVPVLVPVPQTLLPAVGDPLALAPAAGDDDGGFPRGGSFLLEMADAILDDGSGRQATDEDVDRLLWEHGLESFITPKP